MKNPTDPTTPDDQLSFSAGNDIFKKSDDINFTQATTGVEGTGATTYGSSDEAVVTVDSNTGEVHIVGIEGTATVTVANAGDDTYNPVSDSYLLTVTDKTVQASFSAGADQNKLTTDADFTQTATGVEGTGTTTYSSSDTGVATVNSSSGFVHYVGVGTTIITASNSGDTIYNSAQDSCLLTIATDTHFVITIQVTTGFESICIPIASGSSYNYNVDWEDGNSDSGITGDGCHTYASVGTYTIKISGIFPRIDFYSGSISARTITIENWGNTAWVSMEEAFRGCQNITFNAIDTPDLSQVTSMARMFSQVDLSSFNEDMSDWDVSGVSNFISMFYYATSFNQDISSWNVSNGIDMGSMFSGASAFNQDIS